MFCSHCGNQMDDGASFCPKCGTPVDAAAAAAPVEQPVTPAPEPQQQYAGQQQYAAQQQPYAQPAEEEKSKIAAGLLGIFLGALGIHKFYLGNTTAGVIMLVVSLVTCGLGAVVMEIIGLIEGIIYLTKSDADFYRIYVVNKKAWF